LPSPVAANAQSFPLSWVATYEGIASGMNAAETRSYSSWAKIEFGETEGGRYVTYTGGRKLGHPVQADPHAEATATTLSLYFENCMPVEYGSSEPCTSEFKKGDLLFKLVKTKAAGKTVFTPFGASSKKTRRGLLQKDDLTRVRSDLRMKK
jgi:hypothetical protein